LLSQFFNTENSVIGIYASTDFKTSRLKLDVKPSKLRDNKTKSTQEGYIFMFNFHFAFAGNTGIEKSKECLGDYVLYRKESERIVSIYK